MSCDNCLENHEIAFTLTTYVDRPDAETVDLDFCSHECLAVWT